MIAHLHNFPGLSLVMIRQSDEQAIAAAGFDLVVWGRGDPLVTAAPAPTPTRLPTVAEILAATADRFGVTAAVVLGRSRRRPAPDARAAFGLLCRRLRSMSYPEIGALAGSPHSSAITSIRRLEERMRRGEMVRTGPCRRESAREVVAELEASVLAKCSKE